jgi:hypothetical protein
MNEEKFKNELKAAASVKDMFNVIEKYYKIEDAKPGAIVKATLISGLLNGIKITQAKPRQ